MPCIRRHTLPNSLRQRGPKPLNRSGNRRKPLLKTEDFFKSHLVTLAWRFGQSYNGGYVAGQMVMSTLANRQRAGWGSWGEIIERVPTFMAETELPDFKYPNVWEPSFVKLCHVVDGVFDGSALDLSKGALYFCDLNKIEREWFKTKIVDAVSEETGLRSHPIVANMNSLSFFR